MSKLGDYIKQQKEKIFKNFLVRLNIHQINTLHSTELLMMMKSLL